MTRHLRLLGLISIALLALFVAPSVVAAQTPVQDQYQQPPPDNGKGPADNGGNGNNRAPVTVTRAGINGKLPFTGGSVPLVLLIGLVLLAGGLVVAAATRKRRASGSL